MRVGRARSAINGGAGDKSVGPGTGDLGDVLGFHATVDLQADAPAGLLGVGIDPRPRGTQLVQRRRDKGLSAEARIHPHQEDHVELIHDVIQILERRRRIEHQPRLAALLADQ